MRLTRQIATLGFAAALGLALTQAVHAQAPEKKNVTLGVGGKNSLYYIALTIAERRGYFKEQGIDLTINDFRGGAQSLQALVGGSVDVVTGAYEHTIRMQVKGQDIRAVIELGRFPGIAVGHVPDVEGRAEADGCLLHRCWHRAVGGGRDEEGRDRRHLQRRSGHHQARDRWRHQGGR
jgi:NitT/TauT family transport system substrate-binding protein